MGAAIERTSTLDRRNNNVVCRVDDGLIECLDNEWVTHDEIAEAL